MTSFRSQTVFSVSTKCVFVEEIGHLHRVPQKMHDVVVAGSGPTGLMLGLELQRQGLKPLLLDAREDPDVAGYKKWSKALAVHARSLEVLESVGVVEKIIESALSVRAINAVDARGKLLSRFDFIQPLLESKYQVIESLPQYVTEEILRKAFTSRGGEIQYESKVTSLDETVGFVTIHMENKEPITSRWIVGCEGAHSVVRHTMGVEFEGRDIESAFAMVSCKFETEGHPPDEGIIILADHSCFLIPEPDQRMRIIRAIGLDEAGELPAEPPLEYFQKLCDTHLPTLKCQLSEPNWLTVFRIRERIAGAYRQGRMFIAGDAAHTHSPAGGQGMNTGFQDAFNLGWKLAAVVQGIAPTTLLDTYNEERRPIAVSLLKATGAATNALFSESPLAKGVRTAVISTIPQLSFLHRRMAQAVGMLDISYASSSIVSDHGHAWDWIKAGGSLVKAGQRVPVVAIQAMESAEECPMMELCIPSTCHNLFVYASVENLVLLEELETLLRRYGTHIALHVVTSQQFQTTLNAKLYLDHEHQFAHRFGIEETGFVMVRPDHHIGLRTSPADLVLLRSYLHKLFM